MTEVCLEYASDMSDRSDNIFNCVSNSKTPKSKIDRLTDSQINKEHISFYDSAWLFMTLLEFVWHVWLCMTVDDFVWLCKTMYDYIWLCMTIYDNVWICMIMHDCVWLSKYMYNYGWLWKTLYDSV